MRRKLAKLLISALVITSAGCGQQPEGTVRVVVIGSEPELRDPSLRPLSAPDAVLLQNVAQGLVRFDQSGNIVSGLAERWNVSDDGLSFIFRIASAKWPDGTRISAQQVARLLKRQLSERSRNPLKDQLGAVEDIVAMTDRVIEIRLLAPRPDLLALLAQPELAILRGHDGTGPFSMVWTGSAGGEVRLSRSSINDDEDTMREQVLLSASPAEQAISIFARGKTDLVLGGTFADLPLVGRVKLPGNALRFDPASGLFGFAPVRPGGKLDRPEIRRLLSQALDRAAFVNALAVPGLAPRATLLEPGLDSTPAPAAPAWTGVPLADRLTQLRATADRLLGSTKPTVQLGLPDGPGADLLLREVQRDWGAIGVTVERARSLASADFVLIDQVAPSNSPSWFVRRFRCGVSRICDGEADRLMEAGRQTPVPVQRFALLSQAAARIDEAQLFIPIAAPVRWSLVSDRVPGFAGNRYARHTLTGLQQRLGSS